MGSAASRVRILEASGKGGTITIHVLPFHKICRRVTEDKRYGGQVPQLSWKGVCEDGELCDENRDASTIEARGLT